MFSGKMGRLIAACFVMAAVVAAFSWAASAPATDEAARPTVRVCGIRVVGAGFEDGEGLKGRPFNSVQGTTVAVLVRTPGGGLIEFDEDGSSLSVFTDDKGGKLIDDEDLLGEGFSDFPEISKDGKCALLEVFGKGIPGKGARELRLKGSLSFKSATQTKMVMQKGVALKKGTKFEVGPIAVTVKDVGKPDWGKEPLEITLEMNEPGETIAAVRFLDEQGKEIKSKGTSSGSTRLGKLVWIKRGYKLAKKVESVTVEISYWTDMKMTQIPFDLTAGVALSQ